MQLRRAYCAVLVFDVPYDCAVVDRLKRMVWEANNTVVSGVVPGVEGSFVLEVLDETGELDDSGKVRAAGTIALWSRERYGDLGVTEAIGAAARGIEAERVKMEAYYAAMRGSKADE